MKRLAGIVQPIDAAYLLGSGVIAILAAMPAVPAAFAVILWGVSLTLVLTVLAGLWDLYRVGPD